MNFSRRRKFWYNISFTTQTDYGGTGAGYITAWTGKPIMTSADLRVIVDVTQKKLDNVKSVNIVSISKLGR